VHVHVHDGLHTGVGKVVHGHAGVGQVHGHAGVRQVVHGCWQKMDVGKVVQGCCVACMMDFNAKTEGLL